MNNKELLNVQYDINDINRQTAVSAFNGTSFSPEKRGEQVRIDYVSHMDQLVETFSQWVNLDNAAEMTDALNQYKGRYLELCLAWLHSHANLVSTMIAGPSGFPAARMNKRSRWTDNHMNRWLEWEKKAQDRLHRDFNPRRQSTVIRSDDADAIEKLEDKIAQLERNQQTMKDANKIIRSKDSDEDKIGDLVALGLTESNARELLQPDWGGRLGFASYSLSNNNANIKRNRDRLEELKREAERAPADDREVCDGLTVSENTHEVRLQVFFDGKPDTAVRSLMKSNGFRWAPSQGAWQRLLNDNARYAWSQIESQIVELLTN